MRREKTISDQDGAFEDEPGVFLVYEPEVEEVMEEKVSRFVCPEGIQKNTQDGERATGMMGVSKEGQVDMSRATHKGTLVYRQKVRRREPRRASSKRFHVRILHRDERQ